MAKESIPLTGPEGLAKAIEEGRDPNADLDIAKGESIQRAKAGVSLRIAGASYTDIAETLGYSSAFRARQAVEQALAKAADSPEDRDQMRVLTSRRINRLLQSVMGKAVNPKDPQHLAYNARALALVDREARLWGVDAPTQVQVSASDQQIEDYINRVRPLAKAQQDAEEMEILDMGEVD